jgi:hypothetical protein
MDYEMYFPALTRRHMLRGMAGFAAVTTMGLCRRSFAMSGVGAELASTSNPQPVPVGDVVQAELTMSGSKVGTVGAGFVGLSYEKQTLYEPLLTAANTDMVALFKLLGPSVLRVGGNSVDETVWVATGKGQTAGQMAPVDVDAFAGFLKATGWRCIYGVNLGGSANGTTSPALAAAEVAYVAKALGNALIGVEIGNECENYRDADSYYPGNWTVEQFEALWLVYRAAIVDMTPSVKFVGPAAGSNVAGWTLPWAEAVGGSQFGLITQHYYRGPAYTATATVKDLVSYDSVLVDELALLKAGSKQVGVPFRIGECNSYYAGGQPGVSDAYASALWAVDMVFQSAIGGAQGVNFQGGDQGNYALITDTDCVVDGVRPEFYGALLATLAGQGTMQGGQLISGGLNVTAYVVQAAGGGLKIIISNKEVAQHMSLQMDLSAVVGGSLKKVSSATLLAMTQLSAGATGPSLSATGGVKIQGSAVGLDGTFTLGKANTLTCKGNVVSCYVPALSAVVITVA